MKFIIYYYYCYVKNKEDTLNTMKEKKNILQTKQSF